MFRSSLQPNNCKTLKPSDSKSFGLLDEKTEACSSTLCKSNGECKFLN